MYSREYVIINNRLTMGGYMAKQEKRLPSIEVEGYCTYYKQAGLNSRMGFSVKALPSKSLEDQMTEEEIKLFKKQVAYSAEYNNYSLFAGNKTDYLPEEQRGIDFKGKKVKAVISINVAKETPAYPAKAFLNLRSVKTI